MRFVAPLLIFLALGLLLFFGLGNDPRYVPSPLIDKPAPEFALPDLFEPEKTWTKADFLGEVYLLNVWGSWCVACRTEHPFMERIAQRGDVPLYGLNYRDRPEDALRWLQQFGNPYARILSDADGRAGIDFGVYGAPETFLIDAQGIIRHKHVGPVTMQVYEEEFLPRIRSLKAGAM